VPVIAVDTTISGHDMLTLAPSTKLNWVAIEVLSMPNAASRPQPEMPERVLHVGWFTLGDDGLPGTDGASFWMPAVWIEFERFFWRPGATFSSSPTDLGMACDRIAWFLHPGGSARLMVNVF
jgi:hypothetical protein